VSKFVSLGNRVDVGEKDLLEYLSEDEQTRVVGIYLEGIGSEGRTFLEALSRTTQSLPVVVLKGARSTLGAKVAISHTGYFGGSWEVTKSLLHQSGAFVVDTFAEMFASMKILAMQKTGARMMGSKVALMSNGAGPMVCALDLFETSEPFLEVATLSKNTLEELSRVFPDFYVRNNPLDLTGSAAEDDFTAGLRILANDDDVDILMPWMVIQDTPFDPVGRSWIQALRTVSESKPCIAGAMGGPVTKRYSREIEQKSGVPVVHTPEEWVAGARALAWTCRRLGD